MKTFCRSSSAPRRPRGGTRRTGAPTAPCGSHRPANPNPLAYAYLQAGERLGYHHSDDLNGADQEPTCWWDLTIVDGTRQSAADGYLRPALDWPNLTVLTDALVHRLIVVDDRVAAVEYSVGNEVRQVYPQRETILSADSIGSAQLQIGPPGG